MSGPSSPHPSAHAAHHVAGAPGVPGERPVGSTIERWALVALVLAMVALPTAEAIWRRFTGSGVPGAAVYTQHFTLWVGFIGALLATASGHHLALSAVDFIKNEKRRSFAHAFAAVVAAFVCAVLGYASLVMVLSDTGRVDTLPLAFPRWFWRRLLPLVLVGLAAFYLWRHARTRGKRSLTYAALLVLFAGVSFRIIGGLTSAESPGVPQWWFELIMPVAFFVMAYRAGQRAPSRASRLLSWALIAVVIPFAISRIAEARGHPLFPSPNAAALVGTHVGLIAWPGSALLGAAFLLGAPVFVVMAGFALLFFFVTGNPAAAVPTQTFALVTSPTLPAIPLLTVAGYVLAEGGASERLVRAARAVFGSMPGGLAVVAVVTCALFTTFTGASGVTILALGGLLFPALLQ